MLNIQYIKFHLSTFDAIIGNLRHQLRKHNWVLIKHFVNKNGNQVASHISFEELHFSHFGYIFLLGEQCFVTVLKWSRWNQYHKLQKKDTNWFSFLDTVNDIICHFLIKKISFENSYRCCHSFEICKTFSIHTG